MWPQIFDSYVVLMNCVWKQVGIKFSVPTTGLEVLMWNREGD